MWHGRVVKFTAACFVYLSFIICRHIFTITTVEGYLQMTEWGIRERNEGNDGNAGNQVIGMRETRVGMRGIRVGMMGMRGIKVVMRGIKVGMMGIRRECGESRWECGESGWECRESGGLLRINSGAWAEQLTSQLPWAAAWLLVTCGNPVYLVVDDWVS